tara:strand:+ start:40 stop:540 length:501 start_codon:yes stop_codon:yes gene_type:complete
MADYLQIHRGNILNRIPTSVTKILNGSVVEFNYRKKDGTNKKYMVIALSSYVPRGKGLKTKLLSALSMNVMSIDLMRRFSKVVGLPAVDESIKTPIGMRKGVISRFLIPESRPGGTETDAQQFYEMLRGRKFLVEKCYRTFLTKDINMISTIEYDFDNILPKNRVI